MLPSFIGELIISDVNDKYQANLIEASYNYQKDQPGCPIFINIGKNLETLPKLFEIFD